MSNTFYTHTMIGAFICFLASLGALSLLPGDSTSVGVPFLLVSCVFTLALSLSCLIGRLVNLSLELRMSRWY